MTNICKLNKLTFKHIYHLIAFIIHYLKHLIVETLLNGKRLRSMCQFFHSDLSVLGMLRMESWQLLTAGSSCLRIPQDSLRTLPLQLLTTMPPTCWRLLGVQTETPLTFRWKNYLRNNVNTCYIN